MVEGWRSEAGVPDWIHSYRTYPAQREHEALLVGKMQITTSANNSLIFRPSAQAHIATENMFLIFSQGAPAFHLLCFNLYLFFTLKMTARSRHQHQATATATALATAQAMAPERELGWSESWGGFLGYFVGGAPMWWCRVYGPNGGMCCACMWKVRTGPSSRGCSTCPCTCTCGVCAAIYRDPYRGMYCWMCTV